MYGFYSVLFRFYTVVYCCIWFYTVSYRICIVLYGFVWSNCLFDLLMICLFPSLLLSALLDFIVYIYKYSKNKQTYIGAWGVCASLEPPRKREMLCKRCACVCERVGVCGSGCVPLVGRFHQDSFFCSAAGCLSYVDVSRRKDDVSLR